MDRTRRILSLCLVAITVALLAACCTPGLVSDLPVVLRPQETSMWCWAASGQMVMEYLGTNVAQCTQANNEFGRTDCPCDQCGSSPVSETLVDANGNVINTPCVQGGWPEPDKYGFSFLRTSSAALSWDDLRRELAPECNKRPFAFSWAWLDRNGNPDGSGHMMVAKGYTTLEGFNYVSILNPWSPCSGDLKVIPYDVYVEQPGDHIHWDDFYGFVKK
jgi:hypothetical protein